MIKKFNLQFLVFSIAIIWIIFNLYVILQQNNKSGTDSFEIKKLKGQLKNCFDNLEYFNKKIKYFTEPLEAQFHNDNKGQTKTKTDMDNFLPTWKTINFNDGIKLAGINRHEKGFLTLGISSIKRKGNNGVNYLIKTIDDLITKMTREEKFKCVIVVLLADQDKPYKNEVLNEIVSNFNQDLNNGLLQVIQVPSSFYPSFDNLKRNFKDREKRIKWRAKQVMDFSFLFLYSVNISEYYIQLEDDIIAAESYISDIRNFIQKQNRYQWSMLEFSELGFIGKLVKSSDLTKMAKYMMTFYDEQPIDWLLRYFRDSMAQHRVILRKPTLFQHIGLISSFDTNKANRLKDRFFGKQVTVKSETPMLNGDNPSASIFTTMNAYTDHDVHNMYMLSQNFFWAKTPKVNDTVTVVFLNKQRLKRLAVITGSPEHSSDILHNGVIQVALKQAALLVDEFDDSLTCDYWFDIGNFQNGNVYLDGLEDVINKDVYCIRIKVIGEQLNWVLFREMGVFVVK